MLKVNVYALAIPPGLEFARLLSLYVPPSGAPTCSVCNGRDYFPEDLLVEWDDGSDQIGDFTSASARIVTTRSTFRTLSEEFPELDCRNLQFHDHPNLYRPLKASKKSNKRIYLPYDGPPLCELVAKVTVPLLLDRSTVEIDKTCQACGRMVFKKISGIEVWNSRGRIPRAEGEGMFFSADDLNHTDFFRPQFTGFLACTARAKAFIEESGFTNIGFREVGEIVPPTMH